MISLSLDDRATTEKVQPTNSRTYLKRVRTTSRTERLFHCSTYLALTAKGVLRKFCITAGVGVEIRSCAHWRVQPLRHYSASHYGGRKRDSDPDSCRLSCLVCWQVRL
jgi:hypothetical protein